MAVPPTPTSDAPEVSVVYPLQLAAVDGLEAFARLVAEGGAARLYSGQSLVVESHLALAHLAGAGIRIPVGMSVSLTPLRHPVEAALQARSIALMTGNSYVAGYGVSEPVMVTALRGAPYRSPRAAAADYVRAVRGLLDGENVTIDSDYTPTHLQLPPLDHPPIVIGLGVLRPRMAQTAGEVADAAITWLTPPRYIEELLIPAIERGADRAGRPRPRVVAVVHAGLGRPGRDPAAMLTAAAPHLRTEHYTDMLRTSGIDADPRRPEVTAKALVEAGGYAYGTPAEVATTLAQYGRAGVDEVVLNPLGMMLAEGPDVALTDLRELLSALRDAPGIASVTEGIGLG